MSETATTIKEGARKAPSFAFWAVVVAVVLLIGIATMLLLQTFAVAADPISPVIARDYAKCHEPSCRTGTLIPELFTRGEPRAAAEQRLVAAGYVDSDGFYARPARSTVPGCTLNYYVITRYDSTDALTMAFAEVASVCK